MVRSLAALWLSALVALLGGPAAARASHRALGQAPALERASSQDAPEAFVPGGSGWKLALDARSRRDHSPPAHAGLAWPEPATPPCPALQPAPSRHHVTGWVPLSGCRSPILTTGPPSHA
jgi:hypothetical protein